MTDKTDNDRETTDPAKMVQQMMEFGLSKEIRTMLDHASFECQSWVDKLMEKRVLEKANDQPNWEKVTNFLYDAIRIDNRLSNTLGRVKFMKSCTAGMSFERWLTTRTLSQIQDALEAVRNNNTEWGNEVEALTAQTTFMDTTTTESPAHSPSLTSRPHCSTSTAHQPTVWQLWL